MREYIARHAEEYIARVCERRRKKGEISDISLDKNGPLERGDARAPILIA